MEVRFAVLADSANFSREGKLNVTGIFDRISAKTFPAAHMAAVLVLQIEAHRGETGSHEVRVAFVDGDGALILESRGLLEIERAPDEITTIRGQNILPFQVIPLPAPGDYSFDIFIDGRYEASVPITASLVGA